MRSRCAVCRSSIATGVWWASSRSVINSPTVIGSGPSPRRQQGRPLLALRGRVRCEPASGALSFQDVGDSLLQVFLVVDRLAATALGEPVPAARLARDRGGQARLVR